MTIPASTQTGSSPDTEYHITVRTGDVKFAGTDADVFVELAGRLAGTALSTKRHFLAASKNDFERGHVGSYTIKCVPCRCIGALAAALNRGVQQRSKGTSNRGAIAFLYTILHVRAAKMAFDAA